MTGGVMEIDLHGCRTQEAVEKVRSAVKDAAPSTYRIRCIHGFHGGTRIREMLRREFGYGLEPRVLRIECGSNEGITELVLREY